MLESDEKYLSKFYEAEFSPYDFMSLFAAINASQRNYSFSRDNLIQFITSCKESNQFCRLLNDIHVKSNGIFNYSEDLDEAMQKLKLGKIFYTISPEKDSTIMIFEDIPMAELIKKRIEYFDEMVSFIGSYIKYQRDMISQAYQRIYEQENIDISNACATLRKFKK